MTTSTTHSSCLARLHVLRRFGGIFIDDTLTVFKPLDHFLRYEMILGWPDGHVISTKLIIAYKDARFLQLWQLPCRYLPTWKYFNALHLLTEILRQLPHLVHRNREVIALNMSNVYVSLYDLSQLLLPTQLRLMQSRRRSLVTSPL